MNTTALCPDPDTLRIYVAGKLSAAYADELSEHFEVCSSCREKVEQLEQRASDPMGRRLRGLQPVAESLVLQGFPFDDSISASKAERAAEATETKIPESIGEYQIRGVLGSGGMGVVYEAVQVPFRRRVAVKVVKAKHRFDPAMLARFQRELEATLRLEHMNIVRAYNAGVFDERPFLVMEYLEGIDLASHVRLRPPIPLTDAIKIVRQAAAGLQYAHDAGFVHRDVKPSNLFLTKSGHVKLLDFGLAKTLEIDTNSTSSEHTKTGVVIGSCDYIAPEQIERAGSVNSRADVYSLGCTLFFLLTGRPPYVGSTVNVFTAHLRDPFPSICELRPDVPASVDELLQRMTDKNVDTRIETVREVADVLHRIRRSLEENASVPPPLPPPVMPSTVMSEVPTIADEKGKTQTEKFPAITPSKDDTKTKVAPRSTQTLLLRWTVFFACSWFCAFVFFLFFRDSLSWTSSEPIAVTETVSLADLPMELATVGSGNPGFRAGTLSAPAPARYVFSLDEKWKSFQARYGLDPKSDFSKTECIFTVKGDGKELFRSEIIRTSGRRSLNINVRDVKRLELIVESLGKTSRNVGVWYEPKLHRDWNGIE